MTIHLAIKSDVGAYRRRIHSHSLVFLAHPFNSKVSIKSAAYRRRRRRRRRHRTLLHRLTARARQQSDLCHPNNSISYALPYPPALKKAFDPFRVLDFLPLASCLFCFFVARFEIDRHLAIFK